MQFLLNENKKGAGNKSGKPSSCNTAVGSASVAMEPLHVFDREGVESASGFPLSCCSFSVCPCIWPMLGEENTAYWLLFKS